jgi:hypothetical protein
MAPIAAALLVRLAGFLDFASELPGFGIGTHIFNVVLENLMGAPRHIVAIDFAARSGLFRVVTNPL